MIQKLPVSNPLRSRRSVTHARSPQTAQPLIVLFRQKLAVDKRPIVAVPPMNRPRESWGSAFHPKFDATVGLGKVRKLLT